MLLTQVPVGLPNVERSCCLQYAGFDLEESPEVEHIQFEVGLDASAACAPNPVP